MTAITSSTMQMICSYRNPQGKEENWLDDEKQFTKLPSVVKLSVAEVGFALNALGALVETAVVAAFTALSSPVYFVNEARFNINVTWLKSSAFTFVWSLRNLVDNFKKPNLLTEERYARTLILEGKAPEIEEDPEVKKEKVTFTADQLFTEEMNEQVKTEEDEGKKRLIIKLTNQVANAVKKTPTLEVAQEFAKDHWDLLFADLENNRTKMEKVLLHLYAGYRVNMFDVADYARYLNIKVSFVCEPEKGLMFG